MATEELLSELTEHFQFLGVDVTGDILTKCVNLCTEYDVEPEAFVEQWMAFSLSNLSGAPPTLDKLLLLEKKEFKKKEQDHVRGSIDRDASRNYTGLTVYNPTYKDTTADQDDEIVTDYLSTTTPKRVKHEQAHSVLGTELSPATYQVQSQSVKYTSRTNSGTVALNFGNKDILETKDFVVDVTVKQLPNEDGVVFSTKSMFGFELLHDKASIFDNHIRYLSKCIMNKAGVTESVSVRHKTQVPVHVVGRIECDADARLNPKSVVLQGTWETSLSQCVSVDLDEVQQYSLFPGQVVVMKGTNPRGDRFIAQEVLSNAETPIHALENNFRGTMKFVIASGPYTTKDNLTYEPLKDLVSEISKTKPQVVILTGPFLDMDHPSVKDNTMAETYKSFLDKMFDSFMSEVNSLSPHTKVIMVSSLKDAFNVNVYPTPAFTTKKSYHNLTVLPDPATVSINGVVVGVTSTDALMHLSNEEISQPAHSQDRLGRLTGHLLAQQCYYPLWPPGPHHPVDAPLWSEHAQLDGTPHVVILPSNFRYFVKNINGCLIVNPEHLTKGQSGGTFARLQVLLDGSSDISKNQLSNAFSSSRSFGYLIFKTMSSKDSESEGSIPSASPTTSRDDGQVDAIRRYLAQKLGFYEPEDPEPVVKVLDDVSVDGIVKYILSDRCKKIITMSGAGISTAAGIPDFRSPGSGLYHNLQKYNLPEPQAIFEINFFRQNPKPFFLLAKELFPGRFKPTVSHYFIRLLNEKGLLLRHYTQNIDTLERGAGLPEDKLVEAHGTFYTAHCLECRKQYPLSFTKDHIFNDEIPICTDCPGVVKPDIVFFGESLPERFQDCVQQDFHDADMLVIMGSSLEVQPFASLIGRVPKWCPRLLVNRERAGHHSTTLLSLLGLSGEGLQLDGTSVRDVAWLGDCDEGCQALADKLGWGDELRTLVRTEHERLETEGNLCQPHGPGSPVAGPAAPPLAAEATPPRPL